jgi:hypothetical protein
MSSIQIIENAVVVDGIHYGGVAETAANNPQLVGGIQQALEASTAASKAAHAAALEQRDRLHADALALEADKAAALKAEQAGLQAELDANLAYQAQVLEKAATVVPEAVESGKFQPVLDLLAFAAKPLADKRRAEEAEKIRALEAEILDRRAKLGL